MKISAVDIISIVGYVAAGGITANVAILGDAIDAAYPGHQIGRQIALWFGVAVGLATVIYRIIQRPTPTNTVIVNDAVTGGTVALRTIAPPLPAPSPPAPGP